MTPELQKEYIITEAQLQKHMQICVSYGQTDDIRKTKELSQKLDVLEAEIRSRPYTISVAICTGESYDPEDEQCKSCPARMRCPIERATREENVLERLIEWFEKNKVTVLGIDERYHSYICYDELTEKLKELRSQRGREP